MLSHNNKAPAETKSETRTMSMLQRVPVILAVTAASYGLTLNLQAPPQKASPQQQHAARR